MNPRDYQATGIELNFDLMINQGKRSVLNVLPTGMGKTVLFSMIADRWQATQGAVLVLAHREELIFQAHDKLSSIMPGVEVAIEMAENKVAAGQTTLFGGGPRVVVASVQSLHKDRIKKFNPDFFSLIIVDEAHHAVRQNKTYAHIIEYFSGGNKPCYVNGFTATPDRADEIGLGEVFESVGLEYEIYDAMYRDGWLVPIEQTMVHVEDLDLSQVSTSMGDLAAGQLDALLSEEGPLHKMATPMIDLLGDKKTLAFCAGVQHAHKLAEILNRHKPGCAVALDGTTDRDTRRLELQRYHRGEYQYLVNCGLFLEGFDEPTVEVVVMGRPTKSRSLYAQCLGRGTRVLPNVIEGKSSDGEFWRLPTPEERLAAIKASAKPKLQVMDFVGNCGRHKLVYASDILSGKESDVVADAASEYIKKKTKAGQQVDIDEAIVTVKAQMAEAEKQKRAQIVAKAQYTVRPIDPFDVFEVPVAREPGWHAGRKPTAAQLRVLENAKIPIIERAGQYYTGDVKKPKEQRVLSFSKASQIIDTLMKRREKDLCTYAQAKLLRQYGESADVTFKEASELITKIKANNWRPLPDAAERAAIRKQQQEQPSHEQRRQEPVAAGAAYEEAPF